MGRQQLDSDRAESVIRALGSIYANVYWGDLSTGQIINYRMSSNIKNRFGDAFAEGSYYDCMKLYSDSVVHENDRGLFDDIITVEKLRTKLDAEGRYSFQYRVVGNGQISYYMCTVISTCAGSDEFVIAFKNVDAMVRENKRISLELEEALKRAEQALQSERESMSVISSIAKIYHTMHLFDIKNRELYEVNTNPFIHRVVEENKDRDIQEIIHEVMRQTTRIEYIDDILEFTSFDTLSERLEGKRIISMEFEGLFNGWTIASFIRVDGDENSDSERVLYVTRIIDDAKRREEYLIKLARLDQLTELYNRRAYEEDISKLLENGINQDLAYIAFDLNGLKRTNDTKGHSAGDEMIKGTARCLMDAFGNVGRVYRTGGDEFIVMGQISDEVLEKHLKLFDKYVSEWSGVMVDKLSISRGFTTHSEFPDYSIIDIEKLADRRMYVDKDNYYKSTGYDRRHR